MKRAILFFLALFALLSVPVWGTFAQATNPELFVGSFGGDTLSGLTWPVGSTPENWNIQNHAGSGGLDLVLNSVTFTQNGTSLAVTGLPSNGTILRPYVPPNFDNVLLTVTCDSSAGGSTGTLTINSNDPDEGTWLITFVCGSGTPPAGEPNLFFGNFGGHIPNGITWGLDPDIDEVWFIQNHAGPTGGDLVLSSVTLGSSDPGLSATGLPAANTILRSYGANQTYDSVAITFTCDPGDEEIAADFTINSNDPDEPTYVIHFTCGEDVVPGPGPEPGPAPSMLGCSPFDLDPGIVQGRILSTINAYYEPVEGSTAPVVLPAGSAWWIIGMRSGFYKIWVSCDAEPLWVPADAMGPNYEAPWFGAPLPNAGA